MRAAVAALVLAACGHAGPAPAPAPKPMENQAAPVDAARAVADASAETPEQELSAAMDSGDMDALLAVATKILATDPGNVPALRAATTASCDLGDPLGARGFFEQLPPHDQEQLARRCARYGIELP